MRAPILLGLLTLGATGCGPGMEAVWFFTYGTTEVVESRSGCDENFMAAECPEEEGGEESPWTETETETVSDGAFFGEILDLPSGGKALVIGDEIYVGFKNGGTWEFEWEEVESSAYERTHEQGYFYKEENEAVITTTVLLDIDGKDAVGKIRTVADIEVTVYESDGWLSDEVGFTYGRIFDDAPSFLLGDRFNTNDISECADPECFISGSFTSTTETPVTARRTNADHDGYNGVSGAYREQGSDDI